MNRDRSSSKNIKIPKTPVADKNPKQRNEIDPKLPVPKTNRNSTENNHPSARLPPRTTTNKPVQEKKSHKIETDNYLNDSAFKLRNNSKDRVSNVGYSPKNNQDSLSKRIMSNTPKKESQTKHKKNLSFTEEMTTPIKRNRSISKNSLNKSVNQESNSRKNSEGRLSPVKKPPFDKIISPVKKNNISFIKKKPSHSNLLLSLDKDLIINHERSGSINKKNKLSHRDNSASKKSFTRERSGSKSKQIKVVKRDEQNNILSMTITNAFGVTSTIMKVPVNKADSVKKQTTKLNKKKQKRPENIDNNKELEKISIRQFRLENNQEFYNEKEIEREFKNEKKPCLIDKNKVPTKNLEKKKVKYELQNIKVIKGGNAEIGLVVKKEKTGKKINKGFSPSKTLTIDPKRKEKLEKIDKKLKKFDYLTEKSFDFKETTKSRVEQIDFNFFSNSRDNLLDYIQDDLLFSSNYLTNNYKTLKLEGGRVENISKLIEINPSHISGESAATSSDSIRRKSAKYTATNNLKN